MPYIIFSQIQAEREKHSYDFEQIQSQLDKAHGQNARLSKEREAAQLEADRLREKYDKAQVSHVDFCVKSLLVPQHAVAVIYR